jgi:hypothetical protein
MPKSTEVINVKDVNKHIKAVSENIILTGKAAVKAISQTAKK